MTAIDTGPGDAWRTTSPDQFEPGDQSDAESLVDSGEFTQMVDGPFESALERMAWTPEMAFAMHQAMRTIPEVWAAYRVAALIVAAKEIEWGCAS